MVLLIVFVGAFYIDFDNWFNVEGGFVPYGYSSIFRGATVILSTYLGKNSSLQIYLLTNANDKTKISCRGLRLHAVKKPIEYGFIREGSPILINQKRENRAFSTLIGRNLRPFPDNTVL